MKTKFKKLSVGKKTSTITFEHADSEESSTISDELTALSILLSGDDYSGRIDSSHCRMLRHRFESAIEDVIVLMNQSRS